MRSFSCTWQPSARLQFVVANSTGQPTPHSTTSQTLPATLADNRLSAAEEPMLNAFAESFIGRLRDECLNEHLFRTVRQAREIIAAWRIDYKHARPHTSLAGLTPAEFATKANENEPRAELTYE